ncbi:hypothetical protein NKDENANG_01212 [Candidatus Entotheonellaceae bacterium PAL068K]
MSETLSLNTKAILLLTAPLIFGREKNGESARALTSGEYNRLARSLQKIKKQPADLLTPDADQIIQHCRHEFEKDRIKRLLDRGFLLSRVVEHWRERAIWVVSRADDAYPKKLKMRLRKDAPALLYGCGNREILGNGGGLAVVGSRNADDPLIEYTQKIGCLAAKARRVLISGAAKGVDRSAMKAALDAGGKVAGVLADSLEKAVMNRENRNSLLEERLALISPYDPSAGFNVGHAMQRNKIIYALADAALVVNADLNRGGTWNGAKEQLERLRLVPVYVRSTGKASKGLEALKGMGAVPWPNPENADGFDAVFHPVGSNRPILLAQAQLSFNRPKENPSMADSANAK